MNFGFSKSQMVVIKNNDRKDTGQYRMSIGDVFKIFKDKSIYVLSNGGFIAAKIVSLPVTDTFKVTIKTKSGQEIACSSNCISLTYDKDLGKNVNRIDAIRVADFMLCEHVVNNGTFVIYDYEIDNCKIFDGDVYSEVDTIQFSPWDEEEIYCFELDNNKDYFTLDNGIVAVGFKKDSV